MISMKANQFLRDIKNDNNASFGTLVPLVLTVVIAFALLFIGNYVNGTIHDELDGATSSYSARYQMNNTSENLDSSIDIMQVTIIITILAAAISAIFLFTRYR